VTDRAVPLDVPADISNPGAEKTPPLVGIGASAGGLEALTGLLERLPPDIGSAFVIVQHLDPKHHSILADILARSARMPVSQVKDGMRVKADRIYVIPPNTLMCLRGGALRLEPRRPTSGLHMPIDHFFRSLARTLGSRAMGIVLSGSGSDGALGMAEIKENGGITFAQDGASARFSGMPLSAVATGAVDFVLPVQDIAAELVRIARHPYVTVPPSVVPENAAPPPASPEHLSRLFRLLRSAMGVDFAAYKTTTTLRRITRRMTLRKKESLEEYVSDLQRDPEELKALYHDLLIKVTAFFRDPATFEALQRVVIPALLKDRPPGEGRPLRVWVPGCASGEEAYSIAICFLECLGDRSDGVPLRLFATDVDEAALRKARAGVYIENIKADVSPERLRDFFSLSGREYRINKSVREMCTFARHDLGKDPPFSSLDLVSCRNLLIYFDSALQKRVLPSFHYALKPGGFLSLGVSESVGAFSALFDVVDKKQKIYARVPGPARLDPPDFLSRTPRPQEDVPAPPPAGAGGPPAREQDIYKEADRVLLNRYGPAGVLVDENMEVLQFRGDTGRFLLSPPGKASLNLLKMAREGLLAEIKAAVAQARKSGLPADRPEVRVCYDGKTLALALQVIPLGDPSGPRHFVVLFEEAPERRIKGKKETLRQREKARVTSLRRELEAAKENLESTIERRDVTHEELKAASEEVLSSNEELQSTNEELETAKEELQSTNEELSAANEEMLRRNLDLGRANDDLNNLFNSASLPVLMVGSDMRIRRFTRLIEKVLNIIPTDVGRPLGDFRFNLHPPALEPLLAEAVASGSPMEREVQGLSGHWYSVRIQPYKTEEGKLDGAVLSFIDIDSLKGVERLTKSLEDARLARNYSEGVVQTIREPLVTLDEDLRVISANPAFYRVFRASPEEVEGRAVDALGCGAWGIPGLRPALERVLSADAELENFEAERDFPAVGRKVLLLNAKRILLDGAGSKMILLGVEDVTQRRLSETHIQSSLKEKETLLKEIHHRVKNNLQVMSSLLSLRFNTTEDDRTRLFIRESLDRIQAIALVHERLYNSENLAQVDMKSYVQGLIGPLVLSCGKPERISLDIRAEGFFLGPDAAISCGLIINELVSNALKHAFPGGRAGAVSIGLRMTSDTEVFLEVRDDGVGIPEALDVSKTVSLGLRLVQQMVSQLGGRLDIDRSAAGTSVSVRFPFHPEGDGSNNLRSS
jgi:two-component system, chemotaxis family, CheB/CheR fusion protein